MEIFIFIICSYKNFLKVNILLLLIFPVEN